MATFNLRCPKNYPLRCNLLETEKENLERAEKYSAFLMYQFTGQDDYLVDVIKRYFQSPTYHVFDAREEVGLGIKICKICRLAQASDFGIVILTPENLNVYLEAGMMMGMGKRNLYIASRNILKEQNKTSKDVAFDLSDQLVIEHGDKKELLRKLEKEVPPFVDNVIIGTALERDRRVYWRAACEELTLSDKSVLKFLFMVLEFKGTFWQLWDKACMHYGSEPNAHSQNSFDRLSAAGVIKARTGDLDHDYPDTVWVVDQTAAPYLEELVFEEE